MIAPARRTHAADPVADVRGLWQEALKIRQEWLDHGLSTRPADRRTAEANLSAIYARASRPKPGFTWVESPVQALPLVGGLPTLDSLYAWIREGPKKEAPPVASDVAMVASQLRGNLSAGVTHLDPELAPARKKGKKQEHWPELPPLKAFDIGVPLGVVLHQGVHGALYRSLAHGFRVPVREALAATTVPVCWYGQQDAPWIGYYDALHRLGLASYRDEDLDHLGHWAALARSCGWWWPGENVCVVVDRPELIATEPVPGTWHGEVRLDRVRYRDGSVL
ncbi:hypothetical protein J4573_25285 [Actinomadura barringtoniae]|uniref:DUF6745 domain-containing protein n=1 Tax=Actinomadura barringtoniae TaxID=1427535 RepID=A0A939T307_9ACTN|nr:hypothetical protein [Actinomadura barringtoniae]MBO2450441.1 hypothetical protein [Actinomadura barringtoniae]